ncbi:MAG TPA: hypothetical protein VG898_10205 [Solirubrobacterales bacterium]|nr:hypothetical protein [Solirubrobacterales bacterium]
MSGCRHSSGRPGRRLRLPEPCPPGVNYSILSGTLACDPWPGRSPTGNPVVFLRIEFPVAEPDRPQVLRAWASCEIEVAAELAERQEVADLQGGSAVFAAGQLSERWVIEGGRSSRRNVLVAALVNPGPAPPAIEGLGPSEG